MKKLLAVLMMLPVLLAPSVSADARGGGRGGRGGGRGSRNSGRGGAGGTGQRPDTKKKDKQKAQQRDHAENRAALIRDAREDHV